MLPVYVVAFELLIVILFGVFFRLETSTLTNASSFVGILVFLSGFALLGMARRNLSWTSLGNLLILVGMCMQWNLLWTVFWNSCFLGFNKEYTLTITDLIQCLQCTLCLLLVATDLIGKIYYSQLVYISLLLSVGFSLNTSVFTYGIKIYDGGAGMQVFLFSAVFFMVAWICGMRFKKLQVTQKNYWYHTETLGLIGLLLIVYSWPNFNVAGAVITSKNTLAGLGSLQSSAFTNTIFGMAASILCSMLLMTPHEKSSINNYIQAIINGGIMISSITDLLLYPVATIVLGGVASFTTIMLFKYFPNNFMLNNFPQSALRFMFGVSTCIFASIIIASRVNQSPTLANDLPNIAGLEFAGLAITIAIAAIFGAGGGLLISMVPRPEGEEVDKDVTSWEFAEETTPIILRKQNKQNFTKIKQKSVLQDRLLDKGKRHQPQLVEDDALRSINSEKPAAQKAKEDTELFQLPKESIIRHHQIISPAEDIAIPKKMTVVETDLEQIDKMLGQTPKQVNRQLTFDSKWSASVAQQVRPSEIH